jgi:transcriptional regulator with XRE-family HTH domain
MDKLSPAAAKLSPDTEAKLRQLGRALRLSRTERGMTRDQLARKLLLGRNTLERIESGNPAVAIGYYLAVAEHLSVHILMVGDESLLTRSDAAAPRARRPKSWF